MLIIFSFSYLCYDDLLHAIFSSLASVLRNNKVLWNLEAHINFRVFFTDKYQKDFLDPVQFSRLVLSNSLQPNGLQHTRPPCPSATPGVYSNPCPLSRPCHPTISSSVIPSSCLHLSQHQGLFQRVISSHQVAKVLEFELQHQSFQ